MDASLILAIDGVRQVASTAGEVILAVARSGEEDTAERGGERATIAILNDVEATTRAVLGCRAIDYDVGTEHDGNDKRNVLSILGIPLGMGMDRPTPSTAPTAASKTGTTESLDAKQQEASARLKAALTQAQLAPITDIIAVYGNEPLPTGFQKLTHSVTGLYPADLNASSGAKQCWLAVARFQNAPPITGLAVVMLELGEFIPPGFQPVRHIASGGPANLRFGSTSSEAYLCFTRTAGAAVIDVGFAFPHGASLAPALKNILPGATENHEGAPCLGVPRAGFTCTAATLEDFQERKKGVFPLDLSSLIGKSAREDVPIGYIPLTHSVLRSSAVMYGGTARGNAVIVYAKDLSHIDALSNAFSPDEHDVIADFLEHLARTGKASLVDMTEKDFRSIVDAYTYASRSSPVLPLAAARARAAVLRGAKPGLLNGLRKLDGTPEEFVVEHGKDADAPLEASGEDGPRTIGDRIAGAVGKLFGMSTGPAKPDAGTLMSPGKAFTNLFTRGKSAKEVTSPGQPQGEGEVAHSESTDKTPVKPPVHPARHPDTKSSLQSADSDDEETLTSPRLRAATGPVRMSRARSLSTVEPRNAGAGSVPGAVSTTQMAAKSPTLRALAPPTTLSRLAALNLTVDSPIAGATPVSIPSPTAPSSASSLYDTPGAPGSSGETNQNAPEVTESRPTTETNVPEVIPTAEDADAATDTNNPPGTATDVGTTSPTTSAATERSTETSRVRTDTSVGDEGAHTATVMHAIGYHAAASAIAKQMEQSAVTQAETVSTEETQPAQVTSASPTSIQASQSRSTGRLSFAGGAGDDAEFSASVTAETEEARAHNITLFRHLSWMQSPAATRMAVTAASTAPGSDGTVSEANALDGFLVPSAASICLSPLLRALYCRQTDVVSACLNALSSVVSAGFFMTSPVNPEVLPPGMTVQQEHALIASSAWKLLDTITACVCDATYCIIDQVQFPLMGFLTAVLRCAGAGGDASSTPELTPHERFLPPCGLHPSTLYRALITGFVCHTFMQQKRTYAERGWKWCENAGHAQDADTFRVRNLVARRQAGAHLSGLKAMVHGIVGALERDAGSDVTISLAELASPKEGGRSVARTPPAAISPIRSCNGDYSGISRAYAMHTTGSSSLCAEIHAAVQAHVLSRPHPGMPHEDSTSMFDSFAQDRRSPTCDVAVLIGLLSKLATEPLNFTAEVSSAATVSSKRLTAVLHRDTALFLLSEVFALTGVAFCASPVLTACVGRMVVPALFSHAIGARVLNPQLSIVDASEEEDDVPTAVATQVNAVVRGDTTVATVPPMSVFRAVLRVISSMWASRGSDGIYSSSGESTEEGYPTTLREACCKDLTAVMRGLVLQAVASRCSPASVKQDLLDEIATWVAAPQLLMELYMNHDMYPSPACPYPHMRLLRSIVASLVAMAVSKSRAHVAVASADAPLMSPFLGETNLTISHPDTLPATSTPGDRAIAWDVWTREDARKQAATLISSVVRGLMDSAATVYLQPNLIDGKKKLHTAGSFAYNVMPPTPDHKGETEGFSLKVPESAKQAHAKQADLEAALLQARPLFLKSVTKGLNPLYAIGYLERSGKSVSKFLRLCGQELAILPEIGDFLGEEGRSAEEKAFFTELRHEFFGGISFAGLPFDMALRVMLTKAGFRLPGEAQKIERITSAFSVAFYNDNKPTVTMLEAAGCSVEEVEGFVAYDKVAIAENESGKKKKKDVNTAIPSSIATADGRFHPTTVDVVEILSFSCIMLNTDAHNPNIKNERRMTKKQFVANNRQIDARNGDLPRPFLEYLYDAITINEIKMLSTAIPGQAAEVPALSRVQATADLATASLPGTFIADSEVDGADHQLFTSKLTESCFRWINQVSATAKSDDQQHAEAVAKLDEKLPYHKQFSVTTVACALKDLWPHIMKLATMVLRLSAPVVESKGSVPSTPMASPTHHQPGRRVTMTFFPAFQFGSAAPAPAQAQSEPSMPVARLGPCSPGENEIRKATIDTLKFALSAAIFLGMPDEIREGADALLQVEAGTLGVSVANESKAATEGWHSICHAFAADRRAGDVGGVDQMQVAEAISVLHIAVAEMCEAATSTAETATVEKVAERFRGVIAKELVADAKNRRLLYEGDLTKVAAEGRGKHTVYRFFLFNDMLMYASQGVFGGKYAAHQKIPLHNIKIVDTVPELAAQGIHHGFRIDNTVKPLYVYAATEADSRAWKRHINEAITNMYLEENYSSIGSKETRRGSLLTNLRRESEANLRRSMSSAKMPGETPSSTPPVKPNSALGGSRWAGVPSQEEPHSSVASDDDHAHVVGLVDDDDDVLGAHSSKPLEKAPEPPNKHAQPPRPPPRAATGTGHSTSTSSTSVDKPAPTPAPAPAPAPERATVPAPNPTGAPDSVAPKSDGSTSEVIDARSQIFESIAELKTAFLRAVAFCRPLLSSDAGGSNPTGTRVDGSLASPSLTLSLSDTDKLAFYAYFKQATHGECPEPATEDDVSMIATHDEKPTGSQLAITKAKRDAWRRCRGMRRRDAMRAFVLLLDKTVTGWDAVAGAADSK